MPYYVPVRDSNIRDFDGGRSIFAFSGGTFTANSLGKNTPAKNKARQQHFQEQLILIARSLRTVRIPVFLIIHGRECRLDKGCIGHSVASDFLMQPVNGSGHFVDEVIIADDTVINLG